MTSQCLEVPVGQMAGFYTGRSVEVVRRKPAKRIPARPAAKANAKQSWTWIVLAVLAVVAMIPWVYRPMHQQQWVSQSLPLPPQPMAYPEFEPASVAPLAAETVEPMAVILTAKAKTWVEVQADGKTTARVLSAGQQYSFKANEQARILVGNAGGAAVSLNGKAIGPIGANGVARVINITPDGFEILPARSAS